jgi:CRP/FNR family transcriptional regulator, cyclic AMP receptor protein
MSRDTETDLLGALPLFSECNEEELRGIAALVTAVSAPTGEVFTAEGEPGREFFVIVEGRARVTLRDEELATLGRGDFFGEMALLDGQPRAATVTTETPAILYVIGASDFGSLLEEVPGMARKLLRGLAQRLRKVENAPTF